MGMAAAHVQAADDLAVAHQRQQGCRLNHAGEGFEQGVLEGRFQGSKQGNSPVHKNHVEQVGAIGQDQATKLVFVAWRQFQQAGHFVLWVHQHEGDGIQFEAGLEVAEQEIDEFGEGGTGDQALLDAVEATHLLLVLTSFAEQRFQLAAQRQVFSAEEIVHGRDNDGMDRDFRTAKLRKADKF
jgi:hypothetical protein